MSTTVTNMIAGPCSVFEVDGVDVGGTLASVDLTVKRDFTDLECDQYTGSLGKIPSKTTATVTTTLTEITLKNLQIAWGISAAATVNGSTTTLYLGEEKTAPVHTLSFTGPAPNEGTATYSVNKAVSMTAGKMSYAKGKQAGIPVTFELLMDTSKPAGEEYGSVAYQ